MTVSSSTGLRGKELQARILLLCFLLSSCSSEPLRFDPYGRPYDEKNIIKPFTMTACQPSGYDKPPELIFGTRPLYPVDEHLKRKIGTAVVEFRVRGDGSAEPISKTAENVWFANHAVIAMRDWKIQPAMKGNEPMETVCKVSFKYILE